MTKSNAKNEQPEGPKRKFSQEQYDILLRCSEKQDIAKWTEWRTVNRDVQIHLQGANLEYAKLQGANFFGADLQGAELRFANLQGANMWHAALQEAGLERANLQGAKLLKAKLQGAKLDYANLQGAKLGGANLQGADVWGADLSNSDLTDAVLRGAQLHDASFRHADLRRAAMDAQEGDEPVSEAVGLEPRRLGGANLTAARLPSYIAETKFQGALQSVAEASKQAKKLFVIIVSACLYCILTTGVQTAGQALKLPVIGCEIPMEAFYLAAPLLLLALYVYLHASLQQIWDGLSQLPAVFPDGTPMHNRVHPSMLNTIVFLYFPRLSELRPRLAWLRVFLAILLGWYAVPATLLWFLMRYVQVVCELWGLLVLGGLAALSLILALVFRYSSRMTLVGLEDDPWWVARVVRRVQEWCSWSRTTKTAD